MSTPGYGGYPGPQGAASAPDSTWTPAAPGYARNPYGTPSQPEPAQGQPAYAQPQYEAAYPLPEVARSQYGQPANGVAPQWDTYQSRLPEPGSPQAWAQQLAVARPTNTLAIVSLVTSLMGIVIVPVILGHLALNQIKTRGESGRGLAIAGLVIGYLSIAIVMLVVLFFVVMAAAYTR